MAKTSSTRRPAPAKTAAGKSKTKKAGARKPVAAKSVTGTAALKKPAAGKLTRKASGASRTGSRAATGAARASAAAWKKARTSEQRLAPSAAATAEKKKGRSRAAPGGGSKGPALGRAKISGEEPLYMLFKEDFPARQIFDFLRVHTVKELEQYEPQQIVERLSRPITETVIRIRQKLAEKNRCLSGDLEFALDFHQQATHGSS